MNNWMTSSGLAVAQRVHAALCAAELGALVTMDASDGRTIKAGCAAVHLSRDGRLRCVSVVGVDVETYFAGRWWLARLVRYVIISQPDVCGDA